VLITVGAILVEVNKMKRATIIAKGYVWRVKYRDAVEKMPGS
jgi:hypothetical protein